MANRMTSDITQTKVRQLSIDAKSFTPGSVRMDEASMLDHPAHITDAQRLPQYATSCYPFTVPAGPRPFATWQGPGRPEYLQDPIKSTGHNYTFHSDNTFVPALKVPYEEFSGRSQPQVFTPRQYNSQETPDTQILHQPHTLPSSLSPWNVQYTVPFQLPSANPSSNIWMVTPDCLSGQGLPSSLLRSGATMAQVHAIPVHNRLPKTNRGQSKAKKMGLSSNQVSVGIQYEMAGHETELKKKALNRRRTMICKDCETQTDFSSDVSNKNLQVLPSPFYDAASQNWLSGENSTDSEELDSDSVYTASPWKSQLQMAGGTSSTNDTSLFITSVHPNVHALDHQPWLANEAPVSCMYLSEMSDYGGMPQPFTYQTLDDPGMKLMPYDTRFSTGHNRTGCEFSTAFPNGAFWSPVACASPRRGPILDTEQPQLRSQRLKWHRRRDITLNVSQDANKSTCLTHSVGTNAVLGCLRDIEEEFPKLLLAAGELPSSCDIIEMTSAVTGEGKSALPRPENFDPHFKWSDSSSSIYNVKKSAVVMMDGHVKSATKKKQKRQEQLSRAADVELAEISLEQQVLREISSGHRRLVPSFLPADDLQSPTPAAAVVQNPSLKSGSTESVESGGLLTTHAAQPEMVILPEVICKEQDEKLRGNSSEVVSETLSSINHHTMSFGDERISLNNIDLSQSTSSKTSSMDTGGRGTPASADMSPISQTSPLSMSSPAGSPFGSGITSPRNGLTDLNKFSIISQIHSPRFREYCNQVLSRDIDECCTELLQRLVRFQDGYYNCDRANRANSMGKRCTVLGLREVTKHLKMSRLCCVIISPNMEITQSKGGLDKALHNIIKLCEEREVLFVFALGRHALGRACAKLVPVSVVGIFSCDGAEEHFRRLQKLTRHARSAYEDMVTTLLRSNRTNGLQPTPLLNAGHSRTPSRCSLMSVASSILSEPISENDPETDSPAGGEPVGEKTGAEAEDFQGQEDFTENSRDDDDKSHLSESAPTSDESSDEEKVFDEKLHYEADSEDERQALQSLDAAGSESMCRAFATISDKDALQDVLSVKCDGDDNCTQVLVLDILQNSLHESIITQENGHSSESGDTDIMKMNVLSGKKLNECSTQCLTKSKNNQCFESWMTD